MSARRRPDVFVRAIAGGIACWGPHADRVVDLAHVPADRRTGGYRLPATALPDVLAAAQLLRLLLVDVTPTRGRTPA